MLPYFSFDRAADNELCAQAENFLIHTQAALKYYVHNSLDVFNSVYVLGDHVLSPLGPSLKQLKGSGEQKDTKGGNDQRNEPHFLEMYAAFAAIDFFKAEQPMGVNMIARKEEAIQTWYDVPFVSDRIQLLTKIDQLTRFAFAYYCVYYPTLMDIAGKGKRYRAPWYIDFFERDEKIDLSKLLRTELLNISEFCRNFLFWAACVQTTAKEVNIQLFNHNAFADKMSFNGRDSYVLKKANHFLVREFGNLLLPIKAEKPYALSELWERMSDASVDDVLSRGVGRFINALYRECKTGKFVRNNTAGKE
jgi:hypothetical protein